MKLQLYGSSSIGDENSLSILLLARRSKGKMLYYGSSGARTFLIYSFSLIVRRIICKSPTASDAAHF